LCKLAPAALEGCICLPTDDKNSVHLRRQTIFRSVSVASVFAVVLIFSVTNVPVRLTAEDKAIFAGFGFSPPARELSYAEQIDTIRRVQSLVIDRFPNQQGIPEHQPREPKDLVAAGGGLCFDRSRFIEKLLKFHGFETRHVFVVFLDSGGLSSDDGFWRAMTRRGTSSHALSEVRTSKGWMLVGSNQKWSALS